MATVDVCDFILWIKRVRGDHTLREQLTALEQGEVVQLRVAGEVGPWRKMKDGPRGPTAGLQPIAESKTHWHALYGSRRGEAVEVVLANDEQPRPPATIPDDWSLASKAERDAAWEAFKALAMAGWRPEQLATSRDDLHER